MHQESLWHESTEDALRSLVDALGGFKKVGAMLRPTLPVDQAGRWLAQCMDASRPEKLALEDLLFLLAEGRKQGCHVAATFLMRRSGYKDPEPLDVETELQRLQRQFVEAAQSLSVIGHDIQTLSAGMTKT